MKRKCWLFIVALLSCLILLAECGNNKEVDFVKKYKIDLSANEDVSEKLQQAIDELPEDGILYLQDGTYPLESCISFKSNMTFKLSDNAVLLNRSPESNPTMAFNHPYMHNKAEGCSNIVIEGGTWDLNGQLDEEGNPINLPNLESINALGFGYASNVTIRNVTFKDCFNGHVMQFAGMDQVLVENCRFEGQHFRGSGNKTRELIQIEPGSLKGYPYTLLQDVRPTTNVTLSNCYFGGSDSTSQYLIALGTHSQQAGVKCSDILVENCTFENASYANIHFMAYDRITIRGNTFRMTAESQETERYCILADTYGSFLDPSGADSTTELTIENNTFEISASNVTAMEITTNNRSPKKITNILVQNNTITATDGSTAIDLFDLVDCKLEGNTIQGFTTQVSAKRCDDQITSDIDVTFLD